MDVTLEKVNDLMTIVTHLAILKNTENDCTPNTILMKRKLT